MRPSELEEVAQVLEQAERDAGVAEARSKLPSGPSAYRCGVCNQQIPEERRQAWPGTQTCVPCQDELDRALSH